MLRVSLFLLLAVTTFSLPVISEESEQEPIEVLEPTKEEVSPKNTPEPQVDPSPSVQNSESESSGESNAQIHLPPSRALGIGKVISLGARVDASYTGGGSIAQGFAIPSLRVSAYGEAGHYIDYRVSLAQTREFSTALLSQLIPSEAYVDLSTNPPRNGERRKGMDIRLRMGMCAPLFNPWWTADLSDLSLPDYNETHKANFAIRDIGAEVALRPFGENFLVAAGAFNGSGITSLNTNNSKAFTGHFHWVIPLSGFKIGLGMGNFYMEQSTKGSINYKKSWVSDFFLYFGLENARIAILLDSFTSSYEDTTRVISPNGYSVAATMGLNDWMGGFVRYEFATDSPQKGQIRSFQTGPMLTLSDYAKAFFIYQSLQLSGSEERSIFLRVRVSI